MAPRAAYAKYLCNGRFMLCRCLVCALNEYRRRANVCCCNAAACTNTLELYNERRVARIVKPLRQPRTARLVQAPQAPSANWDTAPTNYVRPAERRPSEMQMCPAVDSNQLKPAAIIIIVVLEYIVLEQRESSFNCVRVCVWRVVAHAATAWRVRQRFLCRWLAAQF